MRRLLREIVALTGMLALLVALGVLWLVGHVILWRWTLRASAAVDRAGAWLGRWASR